MFILILLFFVINDAVMQPQHFVHPDKPGPTSFRTDVVVLFVVNVSVALSFFTK